MRPGEQGPGIILDSYEEIGLLRDAFNNAHGYMPEPFMHIFAKLLPDVDAIMDLHDQTRAELAKHHTADYTPYMWLNISQTSVAALLLAHYEECCIEQEPKTALKVEEMKGYMGVCLMQSMSLRKIDYENEATETLDN